MSFFENFFSFYGPVLSMVQASIGMYLSIILTKYISRKFGYNSKKGIYLNRIDHYSYYSSGSSK